MEKRKQSLRVLRSGDPRSQFVTSTAKEILDRLGRPKYLLSSSSKVRKGEKENILTKVLYLTSGLFCPGASKGCLASCLGHSSGFMREQRATDARDRRSALLIEDPTAFMQMLRMELHELRYEAETRGMKPAARLNGTSDLAWELLHPWLFREFKDIQFYDYTKLPNRMHDSLSGWTKGLLWPLNYHLTFSLSENNARHAKRVLERGGNVAAVFDGKLPEKWIGYPVMDGDANDARFRDPTPTEGGPVVVGLSSKGDIASSKDQTGFVIRPQQFVSPAA